jgi:hypothetical protein
MSKKKTASKAQVIHDDNGVSFGANGIPFGTANGLGEIWTIYAANCAGEPLGETGVSDGIAFIRLQNGVLIASDGITGVRFFALDSNQYVIMEVGSYSEAKLHSGRRKH